MLAIRMQRTGRTGHAQFRVIIQDSRFHPTRGRVVAYAGSYDPHSKIATLDTEVIGSYLEKGAQPSDRVARLLKKEGVKLPKWVVLPEPKKSAIKNPDKLRRNRPPEAKTEAPAKIEAATAEPAEAPSEPTEVITATDEPSEVATETATDIEETPVEETAVEPEIAAEDVSDQPAPEPQT